MKFIIKKYLDDALKVLFKFVEKLILSIMSRIIILILMHIFADFFLQGSKLSKLKALKMPFLLEHVGIYTAVFLILSPLILGLTILQGIIFSLLNGSIHLLIDSITGKYKLKYIETDESKYITTVAIDHTLHVIILISSYMLLFPKAY